MSSANETFFTVIGCMDGRVQKVVSEYGQEVFGSEYPDTITWPGAVGALANNPSEELLDSFKSKILISLEKHGSKGIVIDGHQECAGDPVSDEEQLDHIKKTVEVIKNLAGKNIPICAVFVKRNNNTWEVEEIVAAEMTA